MVCVDAIDVVSWGVSLPSFLAAWWFWIWCLLTYVVLGGGIIILVVFMVWLFICVGVNVYLFGFGLFWVLVGWFGVSVYWCSFLWVWSDCVFIVLRLTAGLGRWVWVDCVSWWCCGFHLIARFCLVPVWVWVLCRLWFCGLV